MRVWGRATEEFSQPKGVARAALEGKVRDDLLKEAVRVLLWPGQADRVGVWVEFLEDAASDAGATRAFQGIVANHDGHATPGEWSRLSAGPPLPDDLLVGLQTVEQELDETSQRVMIGMLIEMRRALWVPLVLRGNLRGVLFAGQRKKQAHLPRKVLESVASELALAMELDEERSRGRQYHDDTACIRIVLSALANSQPMGDVLNIILQDCTRPAKHSGRPVAAFAAIGRPLDSPQARTASPPLPEAMCFAWVSGDTAWARALESRPLNAVWRRALESHRVIGMEPPATGLYDQIARVVAFPLQASGENLGVLVAGLRPSHASVTIVEQLELRAMLVTATLLRQKHSEDAKEQAIRQQTLLAAVGAASVVVRADGTIAELSQAAKNMLGVSAPSTPQSSGANTIQNLGALFPATEISRVQAWLQKTLLPVNQGATCESLSVELRNVGRVRLQRLFSTADGGGTILLQPLEVREKGETGQGIAEVVNLIEWLEEGVVLFGPRQEIRALNSRFAQIIGLTPEELASIETKDDLVAAVAARTAEPGDFVTSWHSSDDSALGAVREDLQLVRPVPRLLERAARPIVDKTGALLGRVEIYHDLTAQRVFQSKLLQTEKLAELGQMVTGIAHELSNPLTSILGYAQRLLVRRDALGDSSEARQIFQEAERASTILRQLLLSARESRPERRRVALNQVVARTLELQRFGATAENIRLELDLDPGLPFVQADPGQLQQVLMNLISNARHAITEQGKGGTIRIKTKRLGEKRVLLEVSDDGPGIPQAIQARIFDPFFTTKPPGVGTGLGLAIVLSIVREHGGKLHLTSNQAQKTIFSIELPTTGSVDMALPAIGSTSPSLERAEILRLPEPLETAHTGATLRAWAGTRVLVLEDEPTVAQLIADVLEDEGLQVDVLPDAREALERADHVSYALVICDMKMPEVNGEHFYMTLARAKNPLHARFLFVTGDVLAAHTRDFLERHHLPHVAKPFRVEELTDKVRGVLEAFPAVERSATPAAKKSAARK